MNKAVSIEELIPAEPESKATAQATFAKDLRYANTVSVFREPPELEGSAKTETRVESTDFYNEPVTDKPKRKKKSEEEAQQPYLIIGFDTEFKTPDYLVGRKEVALGLAKYRVLSYQFHAKTSDGKEWQGICCPDGDDRITLGEFLVFALGVGAREYNISNIPKKIYLVGHFTRADIPAFADFQDLTTVMSNVRNTFVSIDASIKLIIDYTDGQLSNILNILIRDTMLLTPQASKSLKEIGKLVGQEKIQLDDDEAKHKEMIRNMDRVRVENWPLFKRYALNDATICVRYIEKIIAQFEQVTGKKKVPVTLTSIGIELLLKSWKEKLKIDPLAALGKESVTESHYDKRKGYYVKKKREVDIDQVSWHLDFVTECYHGGRNEQFWFGPCYEDVWTDYDLSSAYPTAMSLIGQPRWREIADNNDVDAFTPITLGFAYVDFEFPPETRYPVLPVRTEHGLIFPLKGKSYCSAPEIYAARKLGAKITVNRGVIVPSNPDVRIFGEFIKECLKQRKDAGSKTLEGLFWKEISNSTYGKTAQGLRKKRVYDMRDKTTKELPPSKITNPFFAAYITSFTRAILGEIINSLKPDTYVFSCTTDGFLTTASEDEIKKAQQGDLCKLYEQSRQMLTGMPSILEQKHAIRKPLGWRTRGQATLIPGSNQDKGDEFNIVLAKGGIFTPAEYETAEDKNNEIIKTFFDRQPDSMIVVEAMTGVRDMVNFDADLVQKITSKRLSMEYDWKRQPMGVGVSNKYNHVMFSTRPWNSLSQFNEIRDAWDDYTQKDRVCIKSLESYNEFACFVESHSFLSKEQGKYLKKQDGDVHRLRIQLCAAWHESKAGLKKLKTGKSASEFAEILTKHDIPCKKTDVENGKKRKFEIHSCPPTEEVLARLATLKQEFKRLNVEMLLFQDTSPDAVTLRTNYDCPFIRKCD